jgi:hypothetical protein
MEDSKMAKHAIAKKWTSKIDGKPDDGFDLENLNADGKNVKDCKHGTNAIHDGSVTEINKAVYLVKFDEPPDASDEQNQYRGVAIMGLDGEFHHIYGIRKTVNLSEKTRKDLAQDEGTWTGNQP